jgi:ribosome assembly protein YihI (activator of Der GTPase)
MEPRRETNKRPASPAPKQGASKKPQGEASTSTGGEATNQQTGGQNQDLLQHAKQAGGEIVSQVQQQASTQIDRGKETATNELSQVVNAVRQLGQTLSSGEANGPIARFTAQYSDKAADSLERLTNYIRHQDPQRLLNDVQNFGRRQPALLLGGAFLLGFAGARLIKSSIDAASQNSTYSGGYQSRYTTQVPQMNRNVPTPTPRPGTNVI